MILEVVLIIMIIISVILFILYVKSQKARNNLKESNIRLEVELETSKTGGLGIPTMVKTLATDIIKEQSESFKTSTTEPMGTMMENLKTKIENLGKQNAGDREIFNTSMKHMADTTDNLMKDTKTLSDVLKNSQKRGRHAEISLERVFEMSNLTKGIHYDTQQVSEDGRADFVVNLSKDRSIIIDSKAPLDSLWKSFDADDEATKSDFMSKHVTAVKSHVNSLSKKEYWNNLKSSLDYVVIVMPEYALLPALDHDHDLIEYALSKHIVLATPSTLMILLRVVDLMWKQNQMTDKIKDISALYSDLYVRLGKFAEYYNEIGKNLGNAVGKYNDGIGSWNKRILPVVNKLDDVVTGDKMTNLKQVNNVPNRLPIDES